MVPSEQRADTIPQTSPTDMPRALEPLTRLALSVVTARLIKENGIAGGHLNPYKPSAYFLREVNVLQTASDLFKPINAQLA